MIHLRNGRYGLIEIKLGGDRLIEEGAKSLKVMDEKIDTDKMYRLARSFLYLHILTAISGRKWRENQYIVAEYGVSTI